MNQFNSTGLYIIIIGVCLSLWFGNIAQKYRNLDRTSLPISKKKYRKQAIIFIMLSCLAMWLPSALRYNVGIDNAGYLMRFNSMSKLSDAFSYYEPGYGLLCYLCKIIFREYQFLIFITAMLTGGLMWRSIYKYSNNFVLCIIGFLAVNMYFMSYTVIRQFIAVAILTNTIGAIKDKNFTKFLILWILAVSFHYTALVFIVLYFVNSDSDKLLTWRNCFILISTFFFFINIDSMLGGAFAAFGTLREGYALYEETDTIKNVKEVIFLLPFLVFALFYRRSLLSESVTNSVLIWVVLLLVITKIIGVMSPPLSRIHYYFVFGGPILMSYSVKLKSSFKSLVTILIIVYYVWSINLIFNYQWEDFLPYQSIFQNL